MSLEDKQLFTMEEDMSNKKWTYVNNANATARVNC